MCFPYAPSLLLPTGREQHASAVPEVCKMPDLAKVATGGFSFVQASEPLDMFAKGLAGFKETFGSTVTGSGDDTEALVDEIVEWLVPGSIPAARSVLPSTSTRL